MSRVLILYQQCEETYSPHTLVKTKRACPPTRVITIHPSTKEGLEKLSKSMIEGFQAWIIPYNYHELAQEPAQLVSQVILLSTLPGVRKVR